jgi:hypothetical protein
LVFLLTPLFPRTCFVFSCGFSVCSTAWGRYCTQTIHPPLTARARDSNALALHGARRAPPHCRVTKLRYCAVLPSGRAPVRSVRSGVLSLAHGFGGWSSVLARSVTHAPSVRSKPACRLSAAPAMLTVTVQRQYGGGGGGGASEPQVRAHTVVAKGAGRACRAFLSASVCLEQLQRPFVHRRRRETLHKVTFPRAMVLPRTSPLQVHADHTLLAAELSPVALPGVDCWHTL